MNTILCYMLHTLFHYILLCSIFYTNNACLNTTVSLCYLMYRYFAVALINNLNRRAKVAKGTLTVTYQIHLDGRATPLTYTPLDECWSDNIYYFASLNFRRSGNYTVSFLAEGVAAKDIKPLIYPVIVRAKSIIYGGLAATRQLIAMSYLNTRGRQITYQRDDLFDYSYTYNNDLNSLKAVFFTIYTALPFGSLCSLDPVSMDETAIDLMSTYSESDCWNDAMDTVWRSTVKLATTPSELMQCILLLEYSINRSWYSPGGSRLMSRLPVAHFAMRCCTYSSVALRAFCLDKAILYDKVHVPARRGRGTASTSAGGGESSGRREHRPVYKDDSDDGIELSDDGEDDVPRKRKSSRVAAASHLESTSSKRRRVQEEDDFDPTAWTDERRSSRRKVKTVSYAEDEDDNDDDEEDVSPRDSPRIRSPSSSSTTKPGKPNKPVDIKNELKSLQTLQKQLSTRTSLAGSLHITPAAIDLKIWYYRLLERLYRQVDSQVFWYPVDQDAVRGYR